MSTEAADLPISISVAVLSPNSKVVPSTEVVVSISGIPRSYDVGASYDFVINLQHASYDNGGFMLWSYGVGTLTSGEGSQQTGPDNSAVSH